MQQTYIGDAHDFVKYALLRWLAEHARLRLGIAWYLVMNEDRGDGENRAYRSSLAWRQWDEQLFAELASFQQPEDRRLDRLMASAVLPAGTLFHGDPLPAPSRAAWHHASLARLAAADLVFLDPDNGFEVDSMRPSKAHKYAYYEECAGYLRRGQKVLAIQFARQCDVTALARRIRSRLEKEAAGAPWRVEVLRARVAPNLLFVWVDPAQGGPTLSTLVQPLIAKAPLLSAPRMGRVLDTMAL